MASGSTKSILLLLLALCIALNQAVAYDRRLASAVEPVQVGRDDQLQGFVHGAKHHAVVDPASVKGGQVQLEASWYTSRSEYYGAKARISVHELPKVETNHTSLAGIRIINDAPDGIGKGLNTIEAGWLVSPNISGDTQTQLFTYWTSDYNETTGCYNLQCPGFKVEKDSPIKPGSRLIPLSTYAGIQHYITLTIYKNTTSGDWWLTYDDFTHTDVHIGYWPSSLFTSLSEKATMIEYRGFVTFPKDKVGPPMGSGHFSKEGESRAASFKNLQYMDQYNKLYDSKDLIASVDAQDCYDVSEVSNKGGEDGMYFYYGGPWGCKNVTKAL